ncbi:hypothetical protein [Aquimarina rubra]|uniref:Nuclear transport factor 2 family protein n=1 Tax=Aquimarina rubra TaxID=1920033 RepID=A0ABW5LAB9_9FLAO
MKKVIIVWIILSFFNSYSQALNQSEFDMILKKAKDITYNFKHSKDYDFLARELNLNEKNSELIKQSLENLELEFNTLDSRNHLFSFFTESKSDRWLFLNFAAFTSHPRKDKEKVERGTYYFVLYCFAGIKDGKVVFEGARILDQKDSIHKWFLSIHKVYIDETAKVYDKYGFVPPPPFAPPIDLK